MQTPYFLIDADAIRRNLEILRGVMDRTGAHILLAQKCFSCYALYPMIADYLSGATASGLYEARLCHEEMVESLELRAESLELRGESLELRGESLELRDESLELRDESLEVRV